MFLHLIKLIHQLWSQLFFPTRMKSSVIKTAVTTISSNEARIHQVTKLSRFLYAFQDQTPLKLKHHLVIVTGQNSQPLKKKNKKNPKLLTDEGNMFFHKAISTVLQELFKNCIHESFLIAKVTKKVCACCLKAERKHRRERTTLRVQSLEASQNTAVGKGNFGPAPEEAGAGY